MQKLSDILSPGFTPRLTLSVEKIYHAAYAKESSVRNEVWQENDLISNIMTFLCMLRGTAGREKVPGANGLLLSPGLKILAHRLPQLRQLVSLASECNATSYTGICNF